MKGSIYFSAAALVADQADLRDHLATKWYPTAVETPPLATATRTAGTAPMVTGGVVTVGTNARSVAIYARSGGTATLLKLVPVFGADPVTLALPPGSYAVSIVDRAGSESLGAPVDL